MRFQLFSLFLAVCMLFSLAGCRRGENEGAVTSDGNVSGGNLPGVSDSGHTEVLTGVYRAEELMTPGIAESAVLSYSTPYYDPLLGTLTFCVKGADGAGHVVTTSPESGVVSDLVFDLPEGRRIERSAVTEDVCYYATNDEYGGGEVILHRVDLESGQADEIGPVEAYFANAEDTTSPYGFSVFNLLVDADGDLWIGSEKEIVVLDPDFRRVQSFTSWGFNFGMRADDEGGVWERVSDRITRYDKTTGKTRSYPMFDSPEAIFFGAGHDFYYTTSTGVWGADFGENDLIESELLMNYANSGVSISSAFLWTVIDAENFIFTEEGSRRGIYLHHASEDISLSSLRVIEVAYAFDLQWDMGILGADELIVEYNRSHPDRYILMKDYSVYDTDENPDGGVNKLVMDMMTGIYRPDIVIGQMRDVFGVRGTAADTEQIVRQKMYTDLSPWLEKDDTVNRDNLFGAVQRLFATEDGGMWGISPVLEFATLASEAGRLGGYSAESGWSLGELLDYAEGLPADRVLEIGLTQDTAERNLLGPDGYRSFIDTDNAVCSFDSEDFLRWLRFYGNLPADAQALKRLTDVTDSWSADALHLTQTGDAAVRWVSCYNGIGDLLQIEAFFNTKDWSLVGFPHEGGNGTLVSAKSAMMMTSFCEDGDFAWEVIRMLMTDAYPHSCPALKSTFDEKAVPELDHYYQLTINGNSTSTTVGMRGENTPTTESMKQPGYVFLLEQRDIDRLKDFLDNDAGYPMTESVSPQITEIIREEISAYTSGVGTAEDCAKKIQSRVSIWLSEHE